MTLLTTKNRWIVAGLTAFLVSLTGCAAKYHTVRKSQGGENQNGENQKQPDGDDAVPSTQAPSAQVEVVVNGEIVVKVKAGSTFIIRPSESTMDPDDKNRADCRNPGIIKAAYQPGPDSVKTVERPSTGCETLETEHSFSVPGMYEITMVVTSNEQETAEAKMMLEVVPADAPGSELEGGFIIKADPLIVEVGGEINFFGDCIAAKSIIWDFRDQTTGTGAKVVKSYNSPGQYAVTAKCENEQKETLTGQVTVVVVPKKPDGGTPTDNTDSDNNTNTETGTGTDDNGSPETTETTETTETPKKEPETDNDDDKPVNDPGYPGQNPGQNPGQAPGQSPVQG